MGYSTLLGLVLSSLTAYGAAAYTAWVGKAAASRVLGRRWPWYVSTYGSTGFALDEQVLILAAILPIRPVLVPTTNDPHRDDSCSTSRRQ